MNYELLLAWMSHVGAGSWDAFRKAVTYLATDSDDGVARRARIELSDLGHAEFFPDGNRSWYAYVPSLSGLPGKHAALLCGARTPRLVAAVRRACVAAACEIGILERDVDEGLHPIVLRGSDEILEEVATATGIPLYTNGPAVLLRRLKPVMSSISAGSVVPPPHNWNRQFFDLERLRWSDAAVGRTAHEYRSRFGATRYLVDDPERGLVELDRRTAVYAAAMMSSKSLARYDPATQELSTPRAAPLPGDYARVARLCSGRTVSVAEDRLIYRNVPSSIGIQLITLSGGTYPGEVTWLDPRQEASGA